ncbi:pilus assembly protein [Sphingomonas sp. MMSM20]|uniref:TadE/TadG family type IV pilus assembly protein n=1 Tax=Sphingomonas lycopersici TaxID=2951807 RepID=UPI0022379E71|nr:TadE/TadG family type IV pilus assembly protein [Sphingomonas lycopersici]MCW6530597.1 pilus assembly protein [Sphingomonas lycopersici]
MPIPSLLTGLRHFLSRLRRQRSGNVMMLFALAAIPMAFATGMGVDYARAARLRTKMNALADAAALAGVTATMMNKDQTTAVQTATDMFNSQAALLSGVIYNPATLSVVPSQPNGPGSRTITVTYSAQSQNVFGGILGMATIAIGGSSSANNMTAPNIDFYMLLDTSPSMLLPATSAGLSSMVAATNGCAFACHQTNLTYGSNNTELVCDSRNKNCKDFYTVAVNNGIVLRTDLLHTAVSNLTDLATSTSSTNKAQYRMGLFSFDKTFKQLWPTTVSLPNVDASLSTVKTHVTDAKILVYCQNNYYQCSTNDNDTATNFTAAFSGILGAMPLKAGNGTNYNNDTPQAVMFLITDGMWDEKRPGGPPEGPISTASCTAIKNRGIRIAVLYTEYLPDSASDDWSKTNVKAPYLSPVDKISPPLQQCASPGLYSKVTTDGDISGALAQLFQTAVATARLTN